MRRLFACAGLLVTAFMQLSVMPQTRAATAQQYAMVALTGQQTHWKMTVLRINQLDRFPGIAFGGYAIRKFYVIVARLSNSGQHAANLADDLTLVLKVMPPHFTQYTPGWTLVKQAPPFTQMEQAAAKMYGGAVPWKVTRPGATTTYTYLIGTSREDSHYGLYHFDPVARNYRLLFPTGF